MQFALFAIACGPPPLTIEQAEPPSNPTLGDEVWPGTHRSSYAQASTPLAGPETGATADHIGLSGTPVTVSFSAPYEDGSRVGWATEVGLDAAILKFDHDAFTVVDRYVPAEREDDPPTVPVGISGAYTLVDAQGQFVVGRTRFVSIFGDATPGEASSPITLRRRLFVPDSAFCGPDDIIAGMTATFDGHLAFATELGNLFVLPLDATDDDLTDLPVISVNDCAAGEPTEVVGNSLAADEDGGIYLVSSAQMYRFDWDGTSLRERWRAPYLTDGLVSPLRLSPGSGSTPSLMGTGPDQDRFVVITDGQTLMHLVLFWRDEIPEGWEPIAPGRDPRIACEVPVRFGDPEATTSISEQSVAVRGYGAVVVNNLVDDPTLVGDDLAIVQNIVSALEGGDPAKAPRGVERIDWDPRRQICETVWVNETVSIPNGIPSISAASELVYGIEQRDGAWGLGGLDWETGESVLFAPSQPTLCDEAALGPLAAFPSITETLERLPASCENATYAATTVGPDGVVYTGTFFGVSRYTPE